ncbi:hypothetical protein X772_02970 [Mesorhizobium sp. LSJC280B00]|nr:hypothetical protein X772_02970 [Mesorhizobium sp. LSJC280B00]
MGRGGLGGAELLQLGGHGVRRYRVWECFSLKSAHAVKLWAESQGCAVEQASMRQHAQARYKQREPFRLWQGGYSRAASLQGQVGNEEKAHVFMLIAHYLLYIPPRF